MAYASKNPKPVRERTVIDNALRKKILIGNTDDGLTALQLAHKYRLCFNSVQKILKDQKYVYGFWQRVSKKVMQSVSESTNHNTEKTKTKQRNDLTASDRMKELSNDAIEIAEMTLKRMKDLLADPDQSISATQLTAFIQAISSYAIKKVDGTTKSKDDSKPMSSKDQFDMFKSQVSK